MHNKDYVTLNKSVYLECLSKNGDSHLSLNWGSKDSQDKRFKALIDVAQNIFVSNILDVGCGLGHFLDFLLTKGFHGNYTGSDILEEMIAMAKIRHTNSMFEVKNLSSYSSHSYDYVFMSGIFTLADEKIFKEMVSMAFDVCAKGLAFNSLSTWAPQKEDNEFYADPLKTLEFCSKLTPKVVLKHEYLPHDFTIYMYK